MNSLYRNEARSFEIDKIPKKKSLGLAWKELGPDNIGGRVRALLIDNMNPSLYTQVECREDCGIVRMRVSHGNKHNQVI